MFECEQAVWVATGDRLAAMGLVVSERMRLETSLMAASFMQAERMSINEAIDLAIDLVVRPSRAA